MKKIILGAVGLALLGALAYGTVKTLVIDPRTVSSAEEILALFFKARTSLPPLPSPVGYEVVAEQLLEGRFDFIAHPNWVYIHDGGTYYLSEDSRYAAKWKLPMKLLAYEDLASGKVVLAGIPVDSEKLQELAVVDAPAFAPFDGRPVSVESYLMNGLWPRRVVWSAVLKPEADAWDDLVQEEEESTLSVLPMMMTTSEQISGFLMLQDGTNLSVNLPDEFAGATISLESKTNLLDSGWSTVFQTNAPSSGILPLGAADLPDVPCEMIITTNDTETIYIDPIDGSTNVVPAGIYTNYEYSTVAAFYRTAATSTNDADADGLDNVTEYSLGTDYQDADTDDDTLDDGEEVLEEGTNPLEADTDGDGLTDFQESETYNTNSWTGTDPLDPDTDGDGIFDGYELDYGFNPTNDFDACLDPDGDMVPNLYEYKNGSNPTNALSVPVADAVVSTNPLNGTNSIIAAVAQATAASTNGYPIVRIEPGIYANTGCREIVLTNDNILIYGENAQVVVDLEKQGRAFEVTAGRPVLSGLVIKRGEHTKGGAVYVSAGDPVMRNCIFKNNRASSAGGAVRIDSAADLLALNCIFGGNSAGPGAGGAVRCDNDNPRTINCTFVGNYSASSGGAIYNGTVQNCVAWGNNAGNASSAQIYSANVSYSCVEGGYGSGAGITTNDPHLVQNSWLIASTNSSCINGGSGVDAAVIDINGELRDAWVDIGADEFRDNDGDGLSDLMEELLASQVDTDGDEVSDYDELFNSYTDPLDPDTDKDGIDDGYEVDYGLDPNNDLDAYFDPDGDMVPNLYEYMNGETVPTNALSIPDADAVVSTNPLSGTNSIEAAVAEAAATSTNGYPIVRIEPGVYANAGCREIVLTNDNILIYGENAQATIDLEGQGRAFEITAGKPVLAGLIIQNGDASVYYYYNGGGAISIDHADPVLRNCVFKNNDAQKGGGINVYYGEPMLFNCVMIGNRALNGGGGGLMIQGYSTSGTPRLFNCTIVDNYSSSTAYAGGIYTFGEHEMELRNCLIWGNSDPQIKKVSTSLVISYSCIQDVLWSGEGNTTNNPCLTQGNWHLALTNSSCMNSGTSVDATLIDLDGEPREGFVDIGADEYVDQDGNELPDWWQELHGVTNAHADVDDVPDGLTNLQECRQGTNPWLRDTDGDGATDFEESNLYNTNWPGTDPLDPDTDGDGMFDKYELDYGLNPTNSSDAYLDPDGDMVPSLYEYMNGECDPTNSAYVPAAHATVTTYGVGGSYTNIQDAVDNAGASNDYPIVFITPGTYYPGNADGIRLTNDHILVYATNHTAVIDGENGKSRCFEVTDGYAVLSGLIMQNGYANTGGGVLVDYATTALVMDCIVTNNRASHGGGVYLDTGKLIMRNSAVVGNTAIAGDGGGIKVRASTTKSSEIEMINCTVAWNYASHYTGGIYLYRALGGSMLQNCLVWGNGSPYYSQIYTFGGTPSMTHSCIQDVLWSGEGNTTNDPHLAYNDWHLAFADSSCIDSGSVVNASAFDIDRELRGAAVDIGADEFVDSDGDGLSDRWEKLRQPPLDHLDSDSDDDGLSDGDEVLVYGTDPLDEDCDNDGLEDGDEVLTHGTDPWKADTDGDGLSDFFELQQVPPLDPLAPDSDDDGLSDYDELNVYGSDPLTHDSMLDTDGDHVLDVQENVLGTSPSNASDPPQGSCLITLVYPANGQTLN